MRLPTLVLLFATACHHGGPTGPADSGPPDGGHPLPGPGIAAAWKISDAKDLVAGPSTGGRVGDWELANSRIKVVIEDARPSDGYDPYGCSIAAADRERAAGEPGESRFGEVWMGLNFRAAGCSSMKLVNDGADGEPAVIRGEGTDEESPFMASLFPQQFAPPSLEAEIFREYSLAPDSDVLLLNLTISNIGQSDLYLNKPYLGMAMNRGLRHWVSQSGFDFDFSDLARVNTQAEFYAAVGDRVSYSILNLDAPFSPILNFAHVLIGQYPEVHIPHGQAKVFRFALGVGTGDTGTLQVANGEARGAQSDLVPLAGAVVDASGAPIANARVHLTNPAGDQAVAFARTGADGTWTSPVRSGSYALRAVTDDRLPTALQAITVGAAGLSGVTLTLGAQSTIEATATDAQGAPLPSKIVLEPNAPTRPNLPAPLGERWDRQPLVIFAADGHASVPVFPGQWQVTFSRGFEYDRPSFTVTAPAGSSAQVSTQLHRVVDTTGWISGDYHVHAQGSPDGDDLFELKTRAFAADGVEVPISTEHEFIGDFRPTATALGLLPWMHPIAGTELTTTYIGHFNVFPLTPQPAKLNNGGFNWYGRTVPAVLAEARTRLTPDGLVPIVQMNHPRYAGMDYLGAVLFDPDSFQPQSQANVQHWTADWDAMEVWNGVPLQYFEGCPVVTPTCSAPARPTAFDWFAFLDRGRRVTGTGNSDSHSAGTQTVGYPRNYIFAGTDDPAALTDAQVLTAIRGMKVTISGGPFLTIDVGGTGSGGLVQPDFTGGSGIVHLHVKAQAPTWMGPMSRLDLWMGDTSPQGGHLLQSLDLSADNATTVVRFDDTIDVPVGAHDTWLLATVRGPVDSYGYSHALWPVVQSPVPPFAVTNPIFIDANTNSVFDPLR